MKLSRRGLLKSLGLVTVGSALTPKIVSAKASYQSKKIPSQSVIYKLRDGDRFDVVVVGSGAAGMTAALKAHDLGHKVLLIEKSSKFGGSTARSGGGIWIRNNVVNQQSGVKDSIDEALTYLSHVAGPEVDRDKQKAFITKGPQALSYLIENTPLRFRYMQGYSDYYPDLPGAKPQGASIEPKVFDGNILGSELKNLNGPYVETPPGVTLYGGEFKWMTLANVTKRGLRTSVKAIGRFLGATFKGQKPLTMGQALAAGLRAGMLTKNIPLVLNTPLEELITNEKGEVIGLKVKHGGQTLKLSTNKGVIIASGGFEHNQKMREQFQPHPITTEWTAGHKDNTGDGIQAGQKIEADLKLMDDAWWGPTMILGSDGTYFSVSERSLPGTLMVNHEAKRFTNESAPYHDVVNDMYRFANKDNKIVTWMITDLRFKKRYLFRNVLAGLPFPKKWYQDGNLVKAKSISSLAKKINLPEEQLLETINRFNQFAIKGVDEDFKRGNNAYDRYYANPRISPNPSLGVISKAPFYAFRIVPGDLGTKGGLRTNAKSQVLRADGTPIKGLFAAGNTSDSVMGRSYAGAGATLGPGIVFGHIAAENL